MIASQQHAGAVACYPHGRVYETAARSLRPANRHSGSTETRPLTVLDVFLQDFCQRNSERRSAGPFRRQRDQHPLRIANQSLENQAPWTLDSPPWTQVPELSTLPLDPQPLPLDPVSNRSNRSQDLAAHSPASPPLPRQPLQTNHRRCADTQHSTLNTQLR